MSLRATRQKKMKTNKKSLSASPKILKRNECHTISKKQQLESIIDVTLKRGDWSNACELADQYLAAHRDELTYENLLVLGNVFFQGKKFQRAHDVSVEAIKLDSGRHEAPELLFWTKFSAGDSQSDSVLQRLMEDGPDERKKDYLYWGAIRANNKSEYKRVLDLVEKAGGIPDPTNERYSEVMFAYIAALCDADRIQDAQSLLKDVPEKLFYASPNFPMIGAHILRAQGDLKAVINHYSAVLDKFPDLVEAKWNRALARLETGDLERGWEDYECRYDWAGFPSPKKVLDCPSWEGQKLEGKTILLWAEQGIGDQIMFLTLALPWIKDPRINVEIEVHEKLVGLVRMWYPEARVRSFGAVDCRGMEEYAHLDFNLPFGSLPRHFLATHDNIENRPIRFLSPENGLKESLLEKLSLDSNTPIIGFCWRSSMLATSRNSQYLNVDAVETIARNLDTKPLILSLQYGLNDDERKTLERIENVYIPEEDFFEDIVAHGRYVGICDYVLAPRTSTVQLAGLYRRNTLSWGTDGWSFLGQRQYPWYPTVASFELSRKFSHSSLVYQLSRWLNLIIQNDAQSQAI